MNIDRIIQMIMILIFAGLYGYIIISAFSQSGNVFAEGVYGKNLGWDMLVLILGAIYLGWEIKGFVDEN